MNLLDKIQFISRLNDFDIDKLSNFELKEIAKVASKAFLEFKKSSFLDKIEQNILKDDLLRKKKLLGMYEECLNKLSLSNFFITPEKLLFEDINNFSVKQFIELQNNKILFQQFKIRDLQSTNIFSRVKTYKSSESVSSVRTKCSYDQHTNNLSEKLAELLKSPNKRIDIHKYLHNSAHFSYSEFQVQENKNYLLKETRKKLDSLLEKYGKNVLGHIINRRIKVDSEYKELYKANEKIVKENFEIIKRNNKIEGYFLDNNDHKDFVEGKEVVSVYSKQEKIDKEGERHETSIEDYYKDDTESEGIEIIVRWN